MIQVRYFRAPKSNKTTHIFTVTVTIFIIDVNDNAPLFTDSINTNNTVTESAIVGTTIGTITATDADGPNFNTVWYYIE